MKGENEEEVTPCVSKLNYKQNKPFHSFFEFAVHFKAFAYRFFPY